MKNSNLIALLLLAAPLISNTYHLESQISDSKLENGRLKDLILHTKFNETKKIAKQEDGGDEGGGLGEVIGNVVDGAAGFAANVLTNGFRPGHLLAEAAEGLPGDLGESASAFLNGAAEPINQLFNNEVQGVYDLIVGTTPKPTLKPKVQPTTTTPKPTTPKAPFVYLLPVHSNPTGANPILPQHLKPGSILVPSKNPVNSNTVAAIQTTKRPTANLNKQSVISELINTNEVKNEEEAAANLKNAENSAPVPSGPSSSNLNPPSGGTSLQFISYQLSGLNKTSSVVAPSSLSSAQSLSNSLEDGQSVKLSLSNALELSKTHDLVNNGSPNTETQSDISSGVKIINGSSPGNSISQPGGPSNNISANSSQLADPYPTALIKTQLNPSVAINQPPRFPFPPPGFNPNAGEDEDEDSEDEDNEIRDSKVAKRKNKYQEAIKVIGEKQLPS